MRSSSSDFSTRLAALRTQIDAWRATRLSGAPMPTALWDAAAALAREGGLNPVRQALGVSYRSLQLRLATAPPEPTPAAPHFVDCTPLLGSPSEVVLHLSDADGAQLTVRLPRARLRSTCPAWSPPSGEVRDDPTHPLTLSRNDPGYSSKNDPGAADGG